jgi:hypothetical protein
MPGSFTRALRIKTKNVILLVVLYGCETWSHMLWEEHGLRVFKDRIPRKIFGSKREEIIGDWRKPQNEKLHDLYCSPDSSDGDVKKDEVGWACSTHGREEKYVQRFGTES